MGKYFMNANWNMFVEDGKLFITKGADETYYLDEADEEQAAAIYKAYIAGSFDDLFSAGSLAGIASKLEKAGVIYSKVFDACDKKLRVHIEYFGTPSENLRTALQGSISKRNRAVASTDMQDADLALFVRTNAQLRNLLDGYESVTVPHVLVDLGYADTVSIGPLVFKGETACLGCFIGRLARNWGDPVPPAMPAITHRCELVSAFVLEKIDEYANLGNCPDLVNKAWHFNAKTFSSGYDKVYRLPWCPVCGNTGDNPKISFPWTSEAGHE